MLRASRLVASAAVSACLMGTAGTLLGPGAAAVVSSGVPAAAAPRVSPPASFTFSGAGWGHGVGLSQYGALGQAREGRTAEQIVRHYYTGTVVAPVRDDMDLRINLRHRAAKVALRGEALATGGGRTEVTLTGVRVKVALVPAGTVITVRSYLTGVAVTLTPRVGPSRLLGTGAKAYVRWSGSRVAGSAGTAASLLNVTTTVAGLANAGHRYRYGFLQIAPTIGSPTTLEAVNFVRAHDEYLLGIAEISSSWPAAALQSQVLAARSYALAKYGTGAVRSACRCHMDSGYGPYWDQTFVGYAKESAAGGANWRAAVRATISSPTTGKTILYAGKPITAFYSSASGGRTQSSKDVWGGDLPYAQSVDDHWSLDPTVTVWNAWRPRARSQAAVASAFGLPNVVKLSLSDRLVSGALRTATATSSAGVSVTLRGYTFASRMTLPSLWVWRAQDAVVTDPITAAVAVAQARPAGTAVVLAASDDGAAIDTALAASLASARGLPFLLTPKTGLARVTRAELVRRKAKTVYVVATLAEIPAAVLAVVKATGATPIRITGATPSAVSVAVAGVLAAPAGTPVVVASTSDRSVVISAAAAAGALRRPFLLLPAGMVPVPPVVSSYVARLRPGATLLVGSTSAIPDAVGRQFTGPSRVTGVDAPDTAARLALVGVPATSRTVMALVALSARPAAASVFAAQGRPVVWVGALLSPSARAVLQSGRTSRIAVVGAVAPTVVTAARRA